jgi:hypothetical protein
MQTPSYGSDNFDAACSSNSRRHRPKLRGAILRLEIADLKTTGIYAHGVPTVKAALQAARLGVTHAYSQASGEAEGR